MIPRKIRAFVTLAACSAFSSYTAADVTPSSTGADLEPIIVTASKRSEDVREVPVSISVVRGEDLQALHIADFTDLSQSVPDLSFTSQGGPGLSTLELRGISSAAGSSTVGIYIDEVPVTIRNLLTLGNTEPQFFDMSRIEVLRGPQGTLYGASSEGGTIRFISNRPDLNDWASDVRSDLSTTEHGGTNYLGSLVLNVPLVAGVVGLRIGLQHSTDSGYINQVSPINGNVIYPGINGVSTDVVRVLLDAKPNESLTITPALFYQRTAANDVDAYYLNPYTNPATGATLLLSPLSTAKLVREPGLDTLAVPSLTIVDQLGFAELTSITSGFYRAFDRIQDGTIGDSTYFGGVLTSLGYNGNAVNALPGYIYINNYNRSATEEVRLASPSLAPHETGWTWLAGLYFSAAEITVSDDEPIPGFTQTVENVTGLPPSAPSLFSMPFPDDDTYFSLRTYREREQAMFGEAKLAVTESLKLSAGVRYELDQQSLNRSANFYFNGGPTQTVASSTGHAVTPKVTLTYDVTDDIALYANIAKGYREGGPNRPVPTSVCAGDLAAVGLTQAPTSFNPDHLWNYEVGTKSRLFDNRVNVNLDAYVIRWSQIQQDVYLNVCGYDFYQNLGSAESYGSEVEVSALLTPHLSAKFGGAYDHATFSNSVPSLGVTKGDLIEGAPVWNGSATLEYSAPINAEVTGFGLLNYRGTGNSHGALSASNPDYFRPSYGAANATLGIKYQRWEFSLFDKNIFNEQKTIQRPNIQSVVEGITLRPRTIGIEATAKL
jgi:iron complex outermembrane recepter protein